MFSSLFGRRKGKRPAPSRNPSLNDSIKDAIVGDVISVQGFSLEYEDIYFFLERIDRYETTGGTWHELYGVDGDNRIWVEWSEGHELFVTASDNRRPVGLSSIGLDEEDLLRLDEENSIDNYITVEGQRYTYRTSSEALYFKDNRREGEGEGFYLWEFMSEDELRVLSVSKWEGMPFEAYFSEVISPDSVSLYKGDRSGLRS